MERVLTRKNLTDVTANLDSKERIAKQRLTNVSRHLVTRRPLVSTRYLDRNYRTNRSLFGSILWTYCHTLLHWFSIVSWTKTNVMTEADHKGNKNIVNVSRSNSWRQCEGRGNVCVRETIGFGFTSDYLKKWRGFFCQSCSVVSAKPTTFRHSNEKRFYY